MPTDPSDMLSLHTVFQAATASSTPQSKGFRRPLWLLVSPQTFNSSLFQSSPLAPLSIDPHEGSALRASFRSSTNPASDAEIVCHLPPQPSARFDSRFLPVHRRSATAISNRSCVLAHDGIHLAPECDRSERGRAEEGAAEVGAAEVGRRPRTVNRREIVRLEEHGGEVATTRRAEVLQ